MNLANSRVLYLLVKVEQKGVRCNSVFLLWVLDDCIKNRKSEDPVFHSLVSKIVLIQEGEGYLALSSLFPTHHCL